MRVKMIGSSLGFIVIVGAAIALVFAGVYGLLGLIVQRRAAALDSSVAADETLSSPRQVSHVALSVEPADLADDAPHKVVVDEGLVEELFAEMFSIRATIGQLRSDLHALSAGTRVAAAEAPASRPEDDSQLSAAA